MLSARVVPRLALVFPCLLAPSLWGCSPTPPHPPYAPQATNALTSVDYGPPPGRVELIPDRPGGADAWVDGEWVRRHGRWYWLVGRWVKTPTNATYSPWVVVRASDGTPFYAPSVWKDAKGNPIAAPQALAFARATAGAIVDAQNDVQPIGRNLTTLPASRTFPPSPGSESPPKGTDAPDAGATDGGSGVPADDGDRAADSP